MANFRIGKWWWDVANPSADAAAQQTPQPSDVRSVKQKDLGEGGAYDHVCAVSTYSQEWLFNRLTAAGYQYLLSQWDPESPAVWIRFHETGSNTWRHARCVMHWPQPGSRTVSGLAGASVRFSFITDIGT